MSDIKIHKWKLVATADLKPTERNPRTHSQHQLDKIADSVKDKGWTHPIDVDEDLNVLSGNGRLTIAKHLGMNKVPVIVVAGLSEAKKREYIIADNRIPLEASWDYDILREDFKLLESADLDGIGTGFNLEEITSIKLDDSYFGGEERKKKDPKKAKTKTDDDSTLFELVMDIGNKNRLLDVLKAIKQERKILTIEEALMVLVADYEQKTQA